MIGVPFTARLFLFNHLNSNHYVEVQENFIERG